MDMFEELFKKQQESDEVWIDSGRFRADREYRDEIIIQRLLETVEEVIEIKNSLGVSDHKLNQQITDLYNTKTQIVDVLKYMIGLAQLLEFTPYDIYETFIIKSDRLMKGWAEQKVKMTEEMKVVCIDIDGVVANYEDGYITFLEEDCGLKVVSAGARYQYSFSKRYGITHQKEEELYDQFVKSGGFATLELYPGAKDTIDWIESASRLIPVFVTARPNWLYSRISDDTLAWQRANGFGRILTIYDKDKADVIKNKIAPARVVAFIEDRDKHAVEVAHMGVKLFLIDRSYNRNFNEAEYATIQRVEGWREIGEYLMKGDFK